MNIFSHHKMTRTRAGGMISAAALSLLLIAGCADDSPQTGPDAESGEGQIQIKDAWVKAEEAGMTAAFGIIHNGTDADVTITEVTTAISTTSELHLTVDNGAGSMVMQEAPDGFTVEAGGEFVLEPGGKHLMLMELTEPIIAGDEVGFELVLEDGSTVEFVAVAKDYSGANESYDHGDHSDHEHSEGDHSDDG